MPRKMTKDEMDYLKDHPDAIICLDESLTKQEFKEECDANEILRRAANGIDLSSQLNSRVAQYGDFTNIPDYRESMNIVARANGLFGQLDWKLRERFANDAARLMDFLADKNNHDEAVKLGILNPPKEEAKGGTPAAAAPAATGAESKPA